MLSCNSQSNSHPLLQVSTRTRPDIEINSPTFPHAIALHRLAILITFYSPCLEDSLVEGIRLEGTLALHPGIHVRIRIPLRDPLVDGTTRVVIFQVVGTMISIEAVPVYLFTSSRAVFVCTFYCNVIAIECVDTLSLESLTSSLRKKYSIEYM